MVLGREDDARLCAASWPSGWRSSLAILHARAAIRWRKDRVVVQDLSENAGSGRGASCTHRIVHTQPQTLTLMICGSPTPDLLRVRRRRVRLF